MIRDLRRAHFAYMMAYWATGSVAIGVLHGFQRLRELRTQDKAATAVIVGAALYFGGHVLAAWLRGSFGGWR